MSPLFCVCAPDSFSSLKRHKEKSTRKITHFDEVPYQKKGKTDASWNANLDSRCDGRELKSIFVCAKILSSTTTISIHNILNICSYFTKLYVAIDSARGGLLTTKVISESF